MNDDWRVRVDLHDHGFAHRLGESLQAEELESDLRRSFADRIVISVDGDEMFLYAADRAQAETAQQLVRRIASEHGWTVETELRRWHPIAEIWEDPDNPEPTTPRQERTEREIRNAVERRESAEEGYPAIEVRVTCRSRREAGELSERLDREGIPNVHRWAWVLIGARDEEDGNAIAARLRDELPGAEIAVESNLRAVWDSRPGNPFAWLGGLAG
ncbi:MAG TPA: hypothetical protein VKV21_06690 [Solirubrobacteraceae bacterium]|nr:hypothetical protein [Solirubrobacteraceae bacterium]